MLSDDVKATLFARADLGAKREGDRVHFRCPRHKDGTPSAWMGGGAWGCFACGFKESITTLATELGVPLGNGGKLRDEIEAEFDYVDENGDLLFQVVRYYPKKFLQRRPDGNGGWDWRTKGTRRVLYRLPEVIAAAPTGQNIYIVEGEKHVDRLRAAGLIATTSPGGAGKWQREYAAFLRGANVIVLPDNDEPGRRHAEDVARSLQGIAADVRMVHLPNLPEKGDVLDWLAAGHGAADLDEIAFDTSTWVAPPDAFPPGDLVPEEDVTEKPRGFPPPLSIRDLLEQPEPEDTFLVEPFLPADANVLLAAYPKCFKTGFLLSLSVAAAAGKPFLGMFTVPGRARVGLVLMEDRAHRVRRRLRRICAGLNIELDSLHGQLWHWFRPPLVLTDTKAVNALAGHVKDHDLDVLIVDSWSYVSTGNPNDADIVTPQLMALSAIRDARPGLSVILVHHARKSTQSSGGHDERLTDVIRNSTAFGAWYDSGIVLSRDNETAPIKVRMEMRDLPAPDAFTFTVQDEFPAGPKHGLRPDGWLKIMPNRQHPAVALNKANAEKLAPAILDVLRANPGLSKSQLRSRVEGRAADVDSAFEHLRGQGFVKYHEPEKHGMVGRCYAIR